MKRILLVVLLGLNLPANNYAQSNLPWQDKKCAVVLTYDDAIDQHLDNAVPVLDSLESESNFLPYRIFQFHTNANE